MTLSHSCYELPGVLNFCRSVLSWLLDLVRSSAAHNAWHKLLIDEFQPLLRLAHGQSRLDLETLHNTIRCILCNDKGLAISIIVDALSERQDEAESIFSFLQSINHSPKIRVIVLTRSILQLSRISPLAVKIMMEGASVESDVTLYAKDRISRTQTLQPLERRILEPISEKCSNLFLLSALLLDDLELADTLEDQVEILERAPTGLLDKFDQLWMTLQAGLKKKQRALGLRIFGMLIVARRPLTLEEISAFLALDVYTNSLCSERRLQDPARTVEKLCHPLICLSEGTVQLAHPAIRDFLLKGPLAVINTDAHTAELCLSTLSEGNNTSVAFAAALLRKHLLPTGLMVRGLDSWHISVEDSVPYDYAATHCVDHIVSVADPPASLITKLSEFILSIAAVTWSERLIDIRGRKERSSINAQIDYRAAISGWMQTLPPATRARIPLKDFFVAAHTRIKQKLDENDEEDHLLPYLPSIRLGQYYSIAGSSDADFRQAYEQKKIVVDGFTKVLGKRSPLTLEARTEFINEFFSQGLMAEAENELIEVVSIEKDVLGTESDVYYSALQLLGNAQYYLTKFKEASASLHRSGEGLLRLLGEESWDYQVNNLYHGWVFEREGDLEMAAKLYERITKTYVPVRGKNNGLSIFAYESLSCIYRKKQLYEEAKTNAEFCWEARQRLFTINSNTTVDSGLQLALTYRDSGLPQEALKVLDEVEKSTVFDKDFERICQAKHIRALIAFDNGNVSKPLQDLTKIIDDTTGDKRDQNNRECMWIRPTLATALRYVGRDADAQMVFCELVESLRDEADQRASTPSLDDEPESPAQLKIAEEALNMVKDRDLEGAKQLLREKGLQWRRLADFYIRQGGPPADTAWIAPVRFE